MRLSFLLTATLALCLAVGGTAGAVEEPAGYRMGQYRSPVPATLTGATVVTSQAARDLWRQGTAVFVDVLPRPPKPSNLPEGTVWRDKPRVSIPGSVWLPNTGFGQLSPADAGYLEAGLIEVSGSDAARPLVFFCRADCWMSWNAAKRALEMGYTQVYWYPDGTDGWTAAGWTTEVVEPLTLD